MDLQNCKDIIDITTINTSGEHRSNDLVQTLAISFNLDGFISTSIFRNNLCYHQLRILLMANDVDILFTELPRQAPVSSRLIICLGPDDNLRLRTQWTLHSCTKNVRTFP